MQKTWIQNRPKQKISSKSRRLTVQSIRFTLYSAIASKNTKRCIPCRQNRHFILSTDASHLSEAVYESTSFSQSRCPFKVILPKMEQKVGQLGRWSIFKNTHVFYPWGIIATQIRIFSKPNVKRLELNFQKNDHTLVVFYVTDDIRKWNQF